MPEELEGLPRDSMGFAVAESKLNPGTFFVAVSYVGEDIAVVNFYWALMDISGEIVDMNDRECRIYPVEIYGESLLDSDALSDLLRDWLRESESLCVDPVNFNPKQASEVSFGQMRHMAMTGFLASQGESQFQMPSDAEIAHFLTSGELLDYRTQRELLATIEQLRATAIYSAAVDRGETKPALIVAESLFGDSDSAAVIRARNLIQFARKNGLLTKSQPGLPGGVPTQRATEIASRIRTSAKSRRTKGSR